ncbi:hypothetical protein [Collinsella tanakaei]|uniref:hypothetical protein n=1 Tax=Collinsella tanakaei TaxID=626935 RepID=UPI00195B2541|nr:hypothetical protein [Collinsella tanakaei]MBM6868706.1 hypothetical protein [Collinsella tanakaei]
MPERGCIAKEGRILFVNEGDSGIACEIMGSPPRSAPVFRGICPSRSRGNQNALLAGLVECRCPRDASIGIDCDGQVDIGAMEEMLRAHLDGCDVVCGVRPSGARCPLGPARAAACRMRRCARGSLWLHWW